MPRAPGAVTPAASAASRMISNARKQAIAFGLARLEDLVHLVPREIFGQPPALSTNDRRPQRPHHRRGAHGRPFLPKPCPALPAESVPSLSLMASVFIESNCGSAWSGQWWIFLPTVAA